MYERQVVCVVCVWARDCVIIVCVYLWVRHHCVCVCVRVCVGVWKGRWCVLSACGRVTASSLRVCMCGCFYTSGAAEGEGGVVCGGRGGVCCLRVGA